MNVSKKCWGTPYFFIHLLVWFSMKSTWNQPADPIPSTIPMSSSHHPIIPSQGMGHLLRQVRESNLNPTSFRGGPAQWLWHSAGATWVEGLDRRDVSPEKRGAETKKQPVDLWMNEGGFQWILDYLWIIWLISNFWYRNYYVHDLFYGYWLFERWIKMMKQWMIASDVFVKWPIFVLDWVA